MKFIVFYLCAIISIIKASKCPESKKPHSTNCTVFYNCVNLPSGGYVWVPSECSEGLVFQPYLQTCVLPSDTWSCDSLSSDSSYLPDTYEITKLIDSNESSDMESMEDSLEFADIVDMSYTTDDISDTIDQETVTPNTLMQAGGTPLNNRDKSINNSPITSNQEDDNLYVLNQNSKQNQKDRLSLLNRLINHLLIYKEITIPLDFLAPSLLSVVPKPTISTNVPQFSMKPELDKNDEHNVLMNNLILNYIQNNNLQSTIINSLTAQSTLEIDKIMTEKTTNSPILNKEEENILELPINNLEVANNIILFQDKVGNKQYFTFDKYKSLAHKINPEFTHIIPCIKYMRLLNTSDCTRYYTCDPQSATVMEYSCPLNTAFNKYTRLCDRDSSSVCLVNKFKKEDISLVYNNENGNNEHAIKTTEKNICTEVGKIKDPNSDPHYYICYSSSGSVQDIKTIRMMCPNGLIFCQNKKVCTIKRLCTTT